MTFGDVMAALRGEQAGGPFPGLLALSFGLSFVPLRGSRELARESSGPEELEGVDRSPARPAARCRMPSHSNVEADPSMNATTLANFLASFGLTVIDIVSYLGLAALGTMGVGILLGLLIGARYDPVTSWPHRPLPLFRIHNLLAYATLVLILAHPLLLLFAQKGFGLLEILVPIFAPEQPFENTLGAIALYAMLVVIATSYFRRRMSFRRWKAIHCANYLAALTFIFHSLLTNPNLDDSPIDFADGGKVFVILSVIVVTLAIIARAFFAGRASRQGITVGRAVQDSAERWEGRLRVARTFVETGAVRTVRLMTEDGGPLPFRWKAGQYVTLALATPTGPVRRAYTIASSPNQTRFLEITVKREPAGGGGSAYLHDGVEEGQFLSVKGPQGDFTFTGEEADSLVMIAGGVGVTPMMGTLRHLTEVAWRNPVTLIYGVRSSGDTIFRDELEALAARYPNFRLHLLPTVADDPTWPGPTGHLTPELIRSFAPDVARGRVHLCGPTPMMAAVVPMLLGLGVPEDAIHTEAFLTELPDDDGPGADEVVTVTFARSGRTVDARRGDNLIRLAETNGIDVDYSCRNGECGSCRCRLIEGEVDMPEKAALSAKERADRLVLACVARPISDAITLDL